MCRSSIDGGRRCPSHTDPVLIANRNARRRAKYAKGISKNTPPHAPATVKHAATKLTTEHSLYSNFEAIKGQTLYAPVAENETSELGITTSTYEGYLVENGYIDSVQAKGQINYNKLNEDSYKEFGFKAPSEERKNNLFLNELEELSKEELRNSTPGEENALHLYTTSAYIWMNGSLYANEPFLNKPKKNDQQGIPYFPDDDSTAAFARPVPECLKQAVEKIDSAFAKKTGEQTTVYRGMKHFHAAFDTDMDPEERVASYVSKNYPLGQEVVFDGYQSASHSPSIASGYSDDDGLIFEIKTSSGLNISKVSNYASEREALLPRNSRYMVVGIHNKVKYKTDDADPNTDAKTRFNTTIVQMIEITDDGYIKDSSNKSSPPPLTEKQLATYN